MESFFGTLKSECSDLTCFQTRASARQTVFESVECFSNRVRRPSSLEDISPVAFEQLKSSSHVRGLHKSGSTSNRAGRGAAPTQARAGEGEAGARHLKKSSGHLLAQPTVRFQFIENHRQEEEVEPALPDAQRLGKWVRRLAQTPDELAKAEKMASLPSAFKQRTRPTEASTAVRAFMPSCTLKGSGMRASAWLL